MMGELMGKAFADTVAGAGYEGPGVGAVKVAWERAMARIQVYKSREADDKGRYYKYTDSGEKSDWEAHAGNDVDRDRRMTRTLRDRRAAGTCSVVSLDRFQSICRHIGIRGLAGTADTADMGIPS